ncbi:hypothetical protein PIB30_099097, partial [Stylosanthes scabra]|nr:hypothetical protein [Stylosanthes scabra]
MFFKKLSDGSEKFSMLLWGKELNHVRASFFRVMVKALHYMASEAFTSSIRSRRHPGNASDPWSRRMARAQQ